jgi:hypothetical protein
MAARPAEREALSSVLHHSHSAARVGSTPSSSPGGTASGSVSATADRISGRTLPNSSSPTILITSLTSLAVSASSTAEESTCPSPHTAYNRASSDAEKEKGQSNARSRRTAASPPNEEVGRASSRSIEERVLQSIYLVHTIVPVACADVQSLQLTSSCRSLRTSL